MNNNYKKNIRNIKHNNNSNTNNNINNNNVNIRDNKQ